MKFNSIFFSKIIIILILLLPIGISIEGLIPELTLNTADALTIGKCGVGLNATLGNCFANAILTFYELIFYTLTQIFMVIMGLLMDIILFFSINSNFYQQSGIIELGWEITRDLTNIIFIFALLVVAFKMVLGQDDSNNKSTLMKTILVALVINFSLFISYAIIDASNLLAHTFYNRIDSDVSNFGSRLDSDGVQETKDQSGINTLDLKKWFEDSGIKKSVSLSVASQINPQRIINAAKVNNFIVAFIITTGMGLMNIVLIYIFFKVTMVFLGRILGLMLLAIMAPLAMASITIPFLRKQKYVGWDHWFSEITKLSFSAPIFLFFMWLTVSFVSNEGVLATISRPDPNASWLITILNTYILLFLIAGLLLFTKKITEDMAGDMGNMASKAIGQAAGGTLAVGATLATGGAALAGGVMRGAGAGLTKAGVKGAGKFSSSVGKSLQATNFNFASSKAGKFISEKTGVKMVGSNLGSMSYARADTATRKGANNLRTRYDNLNTGKTPKNVKEWQDNVQESRDELTKNRIENRQRTGAYGKDKAERDSNAKLLKANEDRLAELQAQKAKQSSADIKAEEKRVKDDKAIIQKGINRENENLKDINAQIKDVKKKIKATSNPTVKAALNIQLKSDQGKKDVIVEKIEKLKKDQSDVDKTTISGQISEKKKDIDNQKNDARAFMLQDDEKNRRTTQNASIFTTEKTRKERVDKQASRVGSGDIKTNPSIKGDSKSKKKK